MYSRVAVIILALSLSACSSWVYRYDVPQGNYLEKKGIEKLQVGMTKEQVKFILGSHVVVDPFDNDTWSYIYRLKSGRGSKLDIQKQLVVKFANDQVVSAEGDYKLSENFNTPFNELTAAEQANKENNDAPRVIEELTADDKAAAEKAAQESLKEVGQEAPEAI